jgi:hypothetical protein
MSNIATMQLDSNIHAQINKQLGRRVGSGELSDILIHMVERRAAAGEISRTLVGLIRMAVRANPYKPKIASLLELHNRIFTAWVQSTMPALIPTINRCHEHGLPLPVIVACEKYLPKALRLKSQFPAHYFGIEPIVVRGSSDLIEETYSSGALTLPVDDSYEALPLKVFETCTFFHSLGLRTGILKTDDDNEIHPPQPLDPNLLRAVLSQGDYIGVALAHDQHFDQVWHFGKCSKVVRAFNGRPFRARSAEGQFYYLSSQALSVIGRQYLRFPGCTNGELYEDKAVAETLHDFGILLFNTALDQVFGINISREERWAAAAG